MRGVRGSGVQPNDKLLANKPILCLKKTIFFSSHEINSGSKDFFFLFSDGLLEKNPIKSEGYWYTNFFLKKGFLQITTVSGRFRTWSLSSEDNGNGFNWSPDRYNPLQRAFASVRRKTALKKIILVKSWSALKPESIYQQKCLTSLGVYIDLLSWPVILTFCTRVNWLVCFNVRVNLFM